MGSIDTALRRERIKALLAPGFHKPGDVEDRLGYYVGQLASQVSGGADQSLKEQAQ
jgi:hypothetical protein